MVPLLVDEGWRTEPHLAHGSTGLGLVVQEFLRHRQRDDFSNALRHIRRAAEPEFVIAPGLFAGRAGLMAALTWLNSVEAEDPTRTRSALDRHVRRLAWHVVPYQGNVAFPDTQSLRLSMDMATGSAGILVALCAVLNDDGPTFPLLTADRTGPTGEQGRG